MMLDTRIRNGCSLPLIRWILALRCRNEYVITLKICGEICMYGHKKVILRILLFILIAFLPHRSLNAPKLLRCKMN